MKTMMIDYCKSGRVLKCPYCGEAVFADNTQVIKGNCNHLLFFYDNYSEELIDITGEVKKLYESARESVDENEGLSIGTFIEQLTFEHENAESTGILLYDDTSDYPGGIWFVFKLSQYEILKKNVQAYLISLIDSGYQPSSDELLTMLEDLFGLEVRFSIVSIIEELIKRKELIRIGISYFKAMIDPNLDGNLINAIKGPSTEDKTFESTLDFLLNEGQKYKNSADFQEMINFMSKFKRYSPYNNMLVKIQSPHCTFYATQYDWANRFGRQIKEDATPMLILAPMHPVMLVYDLDSTEGKELPKRLLEFAHFNGEWNPKWLYYLTENANKYMIRVNYRKHSTTSAGFAAIDRGDKSEKMRISISEDLDEPSRFGVLCHELAHVFLGHLGSDQDRWWPSRINLNHESVEIEAEAVAYTVTQRVGLHGSSAAYISSYFKGDQIPEGISIDYIAKIAGKIEEMAKGQVPAPKRKTVTK